MSDYDRCFYELEYLGGKPEFKKLVTVDAALNGSTVPCNIFRGEHGDPKHFQLMAHAFTGPTASDVSFMCQESRHLKCVGSCACRCHGGPTASDAGLRALVTPAIVKVLTKHGLISMGLMAENTLAGETRGTTKEFVRELVGAIEAALNSDKIEGASG